MTGAKAKSRKEECTDVASGIGGTALGAAYVKKYFPPESKENVSKIEIQEKEQESNLDYYGKDSVDDDSKNKSHNDKNSVNQRNNNDNIQ